MLEMELCQALNRFYTQKKMQKGNVLFYSERSNISKWTFAELLVKCKCPPGIQVTWNVKTETNDNNTSHMDELIIKVKPM